jgi:hypothetical protein
VERVDEARGRRARERERMGEGGKEARASLRRRLQVGDEKEERAMGAERWVEKAENR